MASLRCVFLVILTASGDIGTRRRRATMPYRPCPTSTGRQSRLYPSAKQARRCHLPDQRLPFAARPVLARAKGRRLDVAEVERSVRLLCPGAHRSNAPRQTARLSARTASKTLRASSVPSSVSAGLMQTSQLPQALRVFAEIGHKRHPAAAGGLAIIDQQHPAAGVRAVC